jgi:hypothetical protein
MDHSKAINNIVEKLEDKHELLEFLSGIPLSELHTLLLEVYRKRSHQMSHGDLLKNYAANRFVQPSQVNPVKLKRLEIELLQIAERLLFPSIQLSPVAPLGSCSVVAAVDQNKIISALRGTEVVADATNVLALHLCHLLKTGEINHASDWIRLSTTHRHVRAQFYDKPGLLPHFHLLCMVTSGKDKGSYSFEKQALIEHLNVYRTIFRSLFHTSIRVKLSKRVGYTDSEGLVQRLSDWIEKELPEINVTEDHNQVTNSYYSGVQFSIIASIKGQDLNIGDGGFVDWSQKLLDNKKERMLISAIGIERLLN